jgi:hypothetical protein
MKEEFFNPGKTITEKKKSNEFSATAFCLERVSSTVKVVP